MRAEGQKKTEAAGTYVDAAGARHAWTITPAHALVWDKQPYVPVGGAFTPRSMAEGMSDANWQRDLQALETLKARGIHDLIVDPVISAVDVPAASWQKLIDSLEQNGFRYGIAFGAGVTTRLTGVVVKPGTYRFAIQSDNIDPSWRVADCDAAHFVVADKDGVSLKSGEVKVNRGFASVAFDSSFSSNAAVALLFPRKALPASREGCLPDLWAGFDSYRDKLIALFSKVKFGPGLRFFLDPLAHPMGILGEAEYLVPDSPAFRLEFEAYLSRRYGNVEDLMTAWHVVERDGVKDFKQAAGLVPFWLGRRGVPYMWDPAQNKLLQTDGEGEASRFWVDLRNCRNDSIIYFMTSAADLLKREIANVPIVYTCTQQHRMFTNSEGGAGFDGVGISAYARGSALVRSGADAAYSACTDSPRTQWLLVTETLDTSTAGLGDKIGYGSEASLDQDLDWLRAIGAKGFFINGFQVLPENQFARNQLLRAPEQIDWLKRYADRVQKDVGIADGRPQTLPYPMSAAGLISSWPVGPTGLMMVPSLAPGRQLEFGNSYAGYAIRDGDHEISVLWSLQGRRETRLRSADPRQLKVVTPDGQPVTGKLDLKLHTLTITVDSTPIILQNNADDFFPIEAAEDAVKQLDVLLKQAKKAKLPTESYQYQLDNAIRSLKLDPHLAFNVAAESLNNICGVLQPYTWIEGETADPQSFSEVTTVEGASNNSLLTLNTELKPPSQGYGAQFAFTAPDDDSYYVWICCTPPGPTASPFGWIVDATGEPHASTEGLVTGAPFLADRLVWIRLGRVALKKGSHYLTLRVTDRASATGRYTLGIDSIVLTRSLFTPSGTSRPPLADITGVELPSLSFAPKQGKKKSK